MTTARDPLAEAVANQQAWEQEVKRLEAERAATASQPAEAPPQPYELPADKKAEVQRIISQVQERVLREGLRDEEIGGWRLQSWLSALTPETSRSFGNHRPFSCVASQSSSPSL